MLGLQWSRLAKPWDNRKNRFFLLAFYINKNKTTDWAVLIFVNVNWYIITSGVQYTYQYTTVYLVQYNVSYMKYLPPKQDRPLTKAAAHSGLIDFTAVKRKKLRHIRSFRALKFGSHQTSASIKFVSKGCSLRKQPTFREVTT